MVRIWQTTEEEKQTYENRAAQEHSIDRPGDREKSQYSYHKWDSYFAERKWYILSQYDREKRMGNSSLSL